MVGSAGRAGATEPSGHTASWLLVGCSQVFDLRMSLTVPPNGVLGIDESGVVEEASRRSHPKWWHVSRSGTVRRTVSLTFRRQLALGVK